MEGIRSSSLQSHPADKSYPNKKGVLSKHFGVERQEKAYLVETLGHPQDSFLGKH